MGSVFVELMTEATKFPELGLVTFLNQCVLSAPHELETGHICSILGKRMSSGAS